MRFVLPSLAHWLHPALLAVFAATTAVAAEPAATPGFTRVTVSPAVISIPADPERLGRDYTLWLHLHGAPAVVEAQFAAHGLGGVLVNVTLPGLSKVYADHFADEARFTTLVATAADAVRRTHAGAKPGPERIVVSAFSAGFGGVRQLLRQPAAQARITALVMADSIYCGYAGEPARRQVDAALMAGFLSFARLAEAGSRRFVLSHSRQVPDGYASTTETADYLLRELGLARTPASDGEWPGGLRLLTRAQQGGFEVLGFDGEAPEDHMKHLRQLGALLVRVAPPRAATAPE